MPPSPEPSGASVFDSEVADSINHARLAHLASLDLGYAHKRVLDAGCGIGKLAQFFLQRGSQVSCVDARPGNIEELRRRYPDLPAEVADVESETLGPFGRFDIVFCYGLLYHLENPMAALRNMAGVCDGILLLETMVCDSEAPLSLLEDEHAATSDQTVNSFGIRPSVPWVAAALHRAGFPYVYAPCTPPEHPDFHFAPRNDLSSSRDGHPIRAVFVASRHSLDDNQLLRPLIVPAAGEPPPPAPPEPAVSGWPFRPSEDPHLRRSFDLLRQKWGEVPGTTQGRLFSRDLAQIQDADLLGLWEQLRRNNVEGPGYFVRGWYQVLYKDIFRGKRIIDFGCGLGFDTITYAEHGAHVTFVDLAETNVEAVRRICRIRGVQNCEFLVMKDLLSLDRLTGPFDAVYACGSLINAPLWVTRLEAQALLRVLPPGGRWVELAYPKVRWEREGRLPLERWGDRTDGGAPWMEWHDVAKVRSFLAPARFDVVLDIDFHNSDFNWIDLIRRD